METQLIRFFSLIRTIFSLRIPQFRLLYIKHDQGVYASFNYSSNRWLGHHLLSSCVQKWFLLNGITILRNRFTLLNFSVNMHLTFCRSLNLHTSPIRPISTIFNVNIKHKWYNSNIWWQLLAVNDQLSLLSASRSNYIAPSFSVPHTNDISDSQCIRNEHLCCGPALISLRYTFESSIHMIYQCQEKVGISYVLWPTHLWIIKSIFCLGHIKLFSLFALNLTYHCIRNTYIYEFKYLQHH